MSIEEGMILNGHGGWPIIDLRGDPSADTLIEMCDPRIKKEEKDDFISMRQTVREAMESITFESMTSQEL